MASSSFLNSGVPRPVTYGAQNQPKPKMKRWTNGIPSLGGIKSTSVAPRVRTLNDVVQAHESVSVQPGVEETKRGLAFRDEEVIK